MAEGIRQVFGRYEIVRPFGAGGMGELLLARQPGLPGVERLIILKKILPHLAQEPGFLERFLDETRVAASLSHGNIVQVYEVGEVAGEYFMAMEFVDGMDLKEAFHRLRSANRRMPEDLALYVLVEVTKALSYAHEKCGPDGLPLGIVHRDVSPANLLLSMDGQVKLTDFGVAKATLRLSLTLPGTLHGKVYYMSPEQVSGEDCDPRSDIFSLGVVAYEMLAGRRPFEGTSEVAVIDQVRRCEPPPLSQVAPWVPGSLEALVSKALARDPAARYPTMEAFRQALSAYMLEAHTLVSARALSEFLSGLRSLAPEKPVAVTPPLMRPVGAPSLDDVAASLLGGASGTPARDPAQPPAADAPHTRTVAAAVGGPSPVTSPTRSRREKARRMWPWLAATIGLAGLVTGLWAWTLLKDLPMAEEAAPVVQAVPAPATDAAAPLPASPSAPPAPSSAASPATAVPAPDPASVQGTRTAVASPTPQPAPQPVQQPVPRKVLLRSDPSGARVLSGDRDIGRTPMEVTVPASGSMRLELRAEDRGPRTVALSSSSPATVAVTLPPPPGRVKFRFFPADAQVRIDGEVIRSDTNLVDLELPSGSHLLKLTSRAGDRERETPFDVTPGRVRALGTVELGEATPTALESPPPPAPKEAP